MSRTRRKIVDKDKSRHNQAKPYKRTTKSVFKTELNRTEYV